MVQAYMGLLVDTLVRITLWDWVICVPVVLAGDIVLTEMYVGAS